MGRDGTLSKERCGWGEGPIRDFAGGKMEGFLDKPRAATTPRSEGPGRGSVTGLQIGGGFKR